MPHTLTEAFCIPSDLLQKRLTAWRLRPASALKIYATSDFGNELVRLLYAAQYLERMQGETRAILSAPHHTHKHQLNSHHGNPNQLRTDH